MGKNRNNPQRQQQGASMSNENQQQEEQSQNASQQETAARGESTSITPIDELAFKTTPEGEAKEVTGDQGTEEKPVLLGEVTTLKSQEMNPPWDTKTEVKQTAAAVTETQAIVAKEEVKATVAAVTTTEAEVPTLTEYEQYIANIKANGSASIKALLARLEGYASAMRPGRMNTVDVGANNQRVLWDCIRDVVKHKDNEEFRRQWNLLLQFFHANMAGAMGPRYVFRFSSQWNQGKDALDLKQVLINLIHLTCDYTTREKGLKQVDLARTLQSNLLTEHERGRVKGFYNA